MTGTFSIKRRKQANLRPDGQSSQKSLHALGIGTGRSSPHTGSKPGYAHLTDPAPDLAYAAAQEWHVATARPLPPALRPLRPLAPPAPLDVRGRAGSYQARTAPPREDTTEGLLDSPLLTSAQRRRMLHKAGAHGERPAGYRPAAQATPGPRAPRSPAQRRRARKNAAQQARHLARLP